MADGLVVVDMNADRRVIDAALTHLDDDLFGDMPKAVTDAIRYSVRGPGKRLRGILVTYAYRATGGTKNPSLLAAAVEIIHAYSLVHDDLPCMDDDDVRRGRPRTIPERQWSQVWR
jgi:geranylgeranyl pyrophosphate synthase